MDRKCFVQYRGYVEQFAVHVLVLTKWTREQNAEINCETFWNTDSSCSIQDFLLLFYLRYDFIWSLIINGTSFFDPGIFKIHVLVYDQFILYQSIVLNVFD